jgi:hypothetical protein
MPSICNTASSKAGMGGAQLRSLSVGCSDDQCSLFIVCVHEVQTFFSVDRDKHCIRLQLSSQTPASRPSSDPYRFFRDAALAMKLQGHAPPIDISS